VSEFTLDFCKLLSFAPSDAWHAECKVYGRVSKNSYCLRGIPKMKSSIMIWFCMLAAFSAAQTLKTYQSADGVFRFKYSKVLIDCSPLLTQGNADSSVMDACMSQGSVCDDGGGDAKSIACFAYPKDKFQDKPTFIAATFFVAEAPGLKTEQACLQKSPNWMVTGTRIATIRGVHFTVFEIGDNWLGGGQWGPIYRTFHGGACYELGQQTAMARGGYDDEVMKKFTKRDAQDIDSKLKAALHSFEFVK